MSSQYDAIIRGMLLLAIEALDNRDHEEGRQEDDQDHAVYAAAHEAQMQELESYKWGPLEIRQDTGLSQLELEKVKSQVVTLVLTNLIEKIRLRKTHATSTALKLAGTDSGCYWKGRLLTYKEVLEDLEEACKRWSREEE